MNNNKNILLFIFHYCFFSTNKNKKMNKNIVIGEKCAVRRMLYSIFNF